MSALSLQGFSPLPTPRVLLFCLDHGISLSKSVPGAEGVGRAGARAAPVPTGSTQAAAAVVCAFPAAVGFSPSRRAARQFGKLPCTCLPRFAASASQRRSSFSRDNVPLCAGLPAGRGRGGRARGSSPARPWASRVKRDGKTTPARAPRSEQGGVNVGEEQQLLQSCLGPVTVPASGWWLCQCLNVGRGLIWRRGVARGWLAPRRPRPCGSHPGFLCWGGAPRGALLARTPSA